MIQTRGVCIFALATLVLWVSCTSGVDAQDSNSGNGINGTLFGNVTFPVYLTLEFYETALVMNILLIICGTILVFCGLFLWDYIMVAIILLITAIWGFAIFYGFTYTIWASIIVGVVASIVVFILVCCFSKIVMVVVGIWMGFAFWAYFVAMFDWSTWSYSAQLAIRVIIPIVFGILFGLLSTQFDRAAKLIMTALVGSYLVVSGTSYFGGLGISALQLTLPSTAGMSCTDISLCWMTFGVWIIGTGLGMVVQVILNDRVRRIGYRRTFCACCPRTRCSGCCSWLQQKLYPMKRKKNKGNANSGGGGGGGGGGGSDSESDNGSDSDDGGSDGGDGDGRKGGKRVLDIEMGVTSKMKTDSIVERDLFSFTSNDRRRPHDLNQIVYADLTDIHVDPLSRHTHPSPITYPFRFAHSSAATAAAATDAPNDDEEEEDIDDIHSGGGATGDRSRGRDRDMSTRPLLRSNEDQYIKRKQQKQKQQSRSSSLFRSLSEERYNELDEKNTDSSSSDNSESEKEDGDDSER